MRLIAFFQGRNDVMTTTLGHLLSQVFESASCLGQEALRWLDNHSSGMGEPGLLDPVVNAARFVHRLDAERIGLIVAALQCGSAHVDDGVIARELLVERGADSRPQIARSRPVRGAVDRTAVAQNDRRVIHAGGCFELTLQVEDGALSGAASFSILAARKPATEKDARSLGEHPHVLAERLAYQFEHRGLATAGPASENDAPLLVPLTAWARTHDDAREREPEASRSMVGMGNSWCRATAALAVIWSDVFGRALKQAQRPCPMGGCTLPGPRSS